MMVRHLQLSTILSYRILINVTLQLIKRWTYQWFQNNATRQMQISKVIKSYAFRKYSPRHWKPRVPLVGEKGITLGELQLNGFTTISLQCFAGTADFLIIQKSPKRITKQKATLLLAIPKDALKSLNSLINEPIYNKWHHRLRSAFKTIYTKSQYKFIIEGATPYKVSS